MVEGIMEEQSETAFDFERHEQEAVSAYLARESFYEDLSSVAGRIISECLKQAKLNVHSVDHRAKNPTSFGKKAAIPSQENANRPKYDNPLEQIKDLAGIRIITYFPGTLQEVEILIKKEFRVLERSDKSDILLAEDRFGYKSIHYLVSLKDDRSNLSEYRRFKDATIEIQVRTILQHAWAEIEHDIQYKSSFSIPTEIRRRFMALAGMLEISDREFQAIQEADKNLAETATANVEAGKLSEVEITPNALQTYLDKRLGPDGRMTEWRYEWMTRLLKRLGFERFDQVDEAIRKYDDRAVSFIAEGSQVGQLNRFENVLLAALGEKFVERHLWSKELWFGERRRATLKKYTEAAIAVDTYDPTAIGSVGEF
jgi:putative GTP pyrophosphokinase